MRVRLFVGVYLAFVGVASLPAQDYTRDSRSDSFARCMLGVLGSAGAAI